MPIWGVLKAQTSTGVLGLLDMFSGGAFSNASVFALGIMPYISASIVVQLLGIAVPYFQRMQREGESGRRKINQITRYLTLIILVLQGSAYLTNLHAQIPEWAFVMKGAFFTISSVLILAAGSMFVLWLGEKITDKGIGNGVSIIIMIGIIARLPFAFVAEGSSRVTQQGGGMVALLVELVVLFLVHQSGCLVYGGADIVFNVRYTSEPGIHSQFLFGRFVEFYRYSGIDDLQFDFVSVFCKNCRGVVVAERGSCLYGSGLYTFIAGGKVHTACVTPPVLRLVLSFFQFVGGVASGDVVDQCTVPGR